MSPNPDPLIAAMQELEAVITNLTGAIREMDKSTRDTSADGGGGLGAIVGAFGGALATMTGALASVAGFVSVIDPTAVEMMQAAMKSIAATIGQALIPVITAMTDVLIEAADTIAPLMAELAPSIALMASQLGEALIPVVRAIVDLFAAWVPMLDVLMPILGVFTDIMLALVNLFRVFVAILTVVMQSIAALFGADFKAGIDTFRSAIKEATRAIILFAVRMAMLFGSREVAESIKKAFSPVAAGGRAVPAPKDFGMAGIEDILKEQNLLAAQAISGKPTNTEDWLEGISAQIDKIMEQQKSLGQIIREAANNLPRNIAEETVGKETVDLVTGAVAAARKVSRGITVAATFGLSEAF